MNTDQFTYTITGWPALGLLLAICFLAYGIPSMKIAKRAGKPMWMGALMSVPVVNIVVIWVFSTSFWRVVLGENVGARDK